MSKNKKPVPTKQEDEDKKKKRRFLLLFWLFIRDKKNLPLVLSIFGGGATVVTSAALVAGAMRVRPEPSSQLSSPISSSSEDSSSEVTYTVTFDSMSGEPVASQTVNEGGLLTYVETSKEGYGFNGWYVSSDNGITLGDAWEFENDRVYQNFTLYASLSIHTYDLTFETNGGYHIPPATVIFGTILDTPIIPEKLGYTFAGWYLENTFTTEFVFGLSTTMPAMNVTLYAKWVINQYTITFDANGGTAVAAMTQDYLSTLTEPEAPTKDGYIFNGWFIDENFTNAFEFTTMPAENITLHAQWLATQTSLIASGRDHTIYLTSTGRLFSVGNGYGATPVEQSLPALNEGEFISKLYANMNQNFFLTSFGRVFKWDRSTTTTVTQVLFNVDTLQAGEVVTQFSTENSSIYALTSLRRVFAWGTNTNGIFNTGNVGGIRNAPQLLSVPSLNSEEYFTFVSNQGYSGYLVTNEGRVFAIGINTNGQLGLGHMNQNQELTFRDVVLSNLQAEEKIINVYGGDGYTLFLSNHNRLFGAGSNNYGNMGIGNVPGNVLTPTLIPLSGLNDSETIIPSHHPGNLSMFVTSLGRVFVAGFLLAGSYYTFTELDTSSILNQGEYVVDAQGGNGHVLMLTNQHRVLGFADNRSGQLGTGDYVSTTTVVLSTYIPA